MSKTSSTKPKNAEAEDVDAEVDVEDSDTEVEKETANEESTDSEPTEDADSDDPEPSAPAADLTAIKGIGPAYSERLAAAGISSVDELSAADAETLADQIDVSPKIVSDWIDRAADQ